MSGQLDQSFSDLWAKKFLTPQQLVVHDVRLEDWGPRIPNLEIREKTAADLVPSSAALTPSSRLLRASEAANNPIERQRLTSLEEQWGWLSFLRLSKRHDDPEDPGDTVVCRWIHVSSKFPTDIQGFLWALSNEDDAKYTVASLHMLDQCIEKHERFSKHGKHFAPFHQPLQQTTHRGVDSGCPLLISIPFLDWGVSGSTPPLRFQVDKREAFSSIRSPAHMLRSLLQHFYRLEDTSRREKEQVFNKHAPWSTDRELDLRVRSWYGRHPTALVVDELWILCIDARHIVTFSSNASWKSRWPPQQLISRISHVSFRANRNACFTAYHKPRTFNALAHSVVCLSGAVGMLHRSFWPDIILCLTDRYADYLSHLQYRLHRTPSTKLVMDLMQVQEELNIVVQIMRQQQDVVKDVLQFVQNQDTLSRSASPVRTNNPPTTGQLDGDPSLDHTQIISASARLLDDLQRECADLQELLNNTNTLVNRTVQLVNIRLEDHGNAILVFTIVTIIFLPLNFISSFFGMNFAGIRNTTSSQSLFWIVAACVTAGVVSASLFVAFFGGAVAERFFIWRKSRQPRRGHL